VTGAGGDHRPDSVGGSAGRTEAEVFLQSRLVLLHKLLFFLTSTILVVSVVLMGFLDSWSQAWNGFGSSHRWMHVVLSAVFGCTWFAGSRWRLRGPVLTVVDAVGLLLTALALATMVSRADTSQSGAMELVSGMLLILAARAIIIPSTGRQTAILSLAASVVCIAAFVWHGRYHPAVLPHWRNLNLSGVGVIMGLWLGLMIATASLASRIIFGLRREIRVAKQIGQYELLEKLGEGGMGVVYRATHALLRRDTALKLLPRATLSPDRLARFEREVRMTARLTHPNTVAIFDYGRTPDGVFYYAMEYLDGIDLERLVAYAGPLPPARAIHILHQVLGSLAEAHDMGLVHRDIKPANVILTERGGESDVAKVVDFGLVKDLTGPTDTGLTAAGVVTGTPLYLSPEAISSPDEVGPTGDIYAVAAVGYFLLTGTHVFQAGSVVEICAHHLHTQPEPPSSRLGRALPAALETAILTGLHKRPEDRFASVRAFRDTLTTCLDGPRWSEAEARAWWSQHRESLNTLRKNAPVDHSGRTMAVDLRQRGSLR
jgi:eukaryotic-like serine/threonine-protein kinase